MASDQGKIRVPKSYASLSLKDLRVSHYPESAPEATPVVVVTLNRPQQRNAFTIDMLPGFETLFPMFDVDERVKCIVLTGAGSAFCAGADLDVGFPSDSDMKRPLESRDSGGRVNLAIYRCRKPTVVALNGPAVGLGLTMTLSAAIRIAHASSKYGFVFSRRGITMESNSSFFLPRLIGYSNAIYVTTTGDVYRGDSKHFGSLFQETVEEKGDVLKRALELATTIAEKTSGLAGHMNREMMWRGKPSAEETHLLDSPILLHMFGTSDCKEGVQSFFEKRDPKFVATLENDGPAVYPWWQEIDTRLRARIDEDLKAKL